MDVTLLHNAKAGDESISRAKLMGLLRDAGYRPRYFPLKQALKDGAALRHGEFVVVAGGDGSIRKVAVELVGTSRPIAPLPLGTANNIACSLGLALEPEKVIAGWARPVRRRIDVGVAKGPWGKSSFIEGIGVGLLERAIDILDDIDVESGHAFSTRGDKLHRDLCVMAALAHEAPAVAAKLSIDGRKRKDEFLLLEILNISRAGPAMELSARADPGDGWLDVVSATADERRKLTRSIERLLGSAERGPILKAEKAREIRLAIGACELRLDDKIVWGRKDFAKHGRARIEIGIRPGALEFLLPGAAGKRKG